MEILVAPYGAGFEADDPIVELARSDNRLRFLPPAPEGISLSNLWMGTVASMQGDWVTIVRPDDMIDTRIDELLAYVEKAHPIADACAWNTFTIDANARRDIPSAVAVPIQHHVSLLEKADMIEAFFHWTDSTNLPKMPYGIYHAAIKRPLLEAVLMHSGEIGWLTPVPQYEWAARVLIHAQQLAFCSRPLSAISQQPYRPTTVPRVISNMPFGPSQGITGAIAEIQCRVLHDLGMSWEGYGDAFVRACMIDCMLENRREEFEAKALAYRAAMLEMGDQRLTQSFQPPYLNEPRPDPRRGLHGRVLLVDRFLGNATTAQEFYDVTRLMLTPVKVATESSAASAMVH